MGWGGSKSDDGHKCCIEKKIYLSQFSGGQDPKCENSHLVFRSEESQEEALSVMSFSKLITLHSQNSPNLIVQSMVKLK